MRRCLAGCLLVVIASAGALAAGGNNNGGGASASSSPSPGGGGASGGGGGSGGSGGGGSGGGAGGGGAGSGGGGGGGGGSNSPLPILVHATHPTFYVLATGTDPITAADSTIAVAHKLSPFMACTTAASCPAAPRTQPATDWEFDSSIIQVVAEPTWAVTDLSNQCLYDPKNTVGGLIVNAIENDTGTNSLLIANFLYTKLLADAYVVTCDLAGNTLAAAPESVAVTQVTTDSNATSNTTNTTVGDEEASGSHITGNQVQTTTTQSALTVASAKTPILNWFWIGHDFNNGNNDYQFSTSLLLPGAIASYYAARTKQTTTTTGYQNTVTANGVAQQTSGSTQVQVGNSNLALLGTAVLATTVSALSNVTLGQTNTTRLLRRASDKVASDMATKLAIACYGVNGPGGRSHKAVAITPDASLSKCTRLFDETRFKKLVADWLGGQ